jgi:hypothetical protein
MADYYPLIARAVAGLQKNTGDARRSLYERAREALVAQLRGVTPALDESDVTRERLSLEEAIRKVEGESARQSTSRSETTRVKAPEFPRWDGPEAEPEPEPEPEPRPRRTQAQPAQPAQRPERPERPEPAQRAESRPAAPAARTRESRYPDQDFEPSPPDPVRPEPVPVRPERPEPPRRSQLRPEARAAAPPPARPKADQRYADLEFDESAPGEPEPQEPPRNSARPRPGAERGSAERADRRSLLDSGLRDFRDTVSEANELGGASARATRSARESFAAVPPEANRSPPRISDSDEAYLTLDDITEPDMLEPSFVVDESRPSPPRARQAPAPEVEREQIPRRSYADLIRIAVAVVIVAGIGSLLIWQWPNMAAIYSMLWAPPAEVVNANPPPSTKPKISDRIEPGGKPSQQQISQDAATVAQRVVLYEEDPNDPQGKRAVGSAVWRTETISPGTGKSPELAVRADIEIPERKISMTWTLRRDTDPSRSTSHTIEIMFKLPPDFPSGGIFNVPGIWMKQAEQTQGTALAGLAVKVTTGYFLIGLSSAPADKERNIQLLKERPWFDIPIVYTNNRRAILAMEKGTPGERAFAQAFAAWEK